MKPSKIIKCDINVIIKAIAPQNKRATIAFNDPVSCNTTVGGFTSEQLRELAAAFTEAADALDGKKHVLYMAYNKSGNALMQSPAGKDLAEKAAEHYKQMTGQEANIQGVPFY